MSAFIQVPYNLFNERRTERPLNESWDSYYAEDSHNLNENDSPSADAEDLTSWFDDLNASAKILAFLTSESFPFSPSHSPAPSKPPSILDLGSGNGTTLLQLRLHSTSPYIGGLAVGVDYSEKSIEVARLLRDGFVSRGHAECADIRFEVMDLIHDEPKSQDWWPTDAGDRAGFDIVLDKGTFDAISLSSEHVPASDGTSRRVCETYPMRTINMVNKGGFLLITSCNWTEDEVVRWFTSGEDVVGLLEVFDTIHYPKFSFGGQEGQGVASVCFKRIR